MRKYDQFLAMHINYFINFIQTNSPLATRYYVLNATSESEDGD